MEGDQADALRTSDAVMPIFPSSLSSSTFSSAPVVSPLSSAANVSGSRRHSSKAEPPPASQTAALSTIHYIGASRVDSRCSPTLAPYAPQAVRCTGWWRVNEGTSRCCVVDKPPCIHHRLVCRGLLKSLTAQPELATQLNVWVQARDDHHAVFHTHHASRLLCLRGVPPFPESSAVVVTIGAQGPMSRARFSQRLAPSAVSCTGGTLSPSDTPL
jgi:hypothetical protein